MMKMNKKGFTIVELVIVIAVIAILAAVMIPTFSGIVTKANVSALEQKVSAAYKEAMAIELADDGQYNGSVTPNTVNNITFVFDANGNCVASWTTPEHGYNGATIQNGELNLTPVTPAVTEPEATT